MALHKRNTTWDIMRTTVSVGSLLRVVYVNIDHRFLKEWHGRRAYSLKCTDSFPFAQGEFYTREHIPSFGDMPNSVYHSVMACTEIDRIQPCKRLMLVGTACQLRALNSIIKDNAMRLSGCVPFVATETTGHPHVT